MAQSFGSSYWRTYATDGGLVDERNISEMDFSIYEPPKVAGGFITFPDGSKFRRTTNYERASLVRHRGNAENSVFRDGGGQTRRCITGPGGCTAGNFTSGNWIFRTLSGFGVPNVLRGPTFQTMEINEATTKALNELADQKANLGENIATLGTTIRMFASPVDSLVKGLKKMRADKDMRPHLTKSFHDLVYKEGLDKRIAGKYLEYIYGFVPLMNDIYSLSELARAQGKRPLLMNARGVARREYSAEPDTYYNASYKRKEDMTSVNATSRTSVSLWAQINPNYHGTRVLNQLGLLNPASLAWELVPYSFVVDWVLPIGPVLQALTAPAGLLFVDGSRSRRLSGQWETTDIRWQVTDTFVSGSPATNKWEHESYLRETITSWPRPGLWVDTDPFRLSRGGSDRLFKALAVAITGLKHDT